MGHTVRASHRLGWELSVERVTQKDVIKAVERVKKKDGTTFESKPNSMME